MDKYLEWIKSDNNNYITLGDLGYNSTLEIDFAPISINGDGWECFLESDEGLNIFWSGASPSQVTLVNGLGFTWNGNVGSTAVYKNVVSGTWYNATFSPTGMTIDGAVIKTYNINKYLDNVRIGPTLDFRHSTGMYGEITVKNSDGDIIKHYLPIERNGVAGMYEEIGQTFHSPAGNAWISGPVTHIFIPSKIKSNFESTGGTDTFTINAETTWTASTPTNFTVSPLTGDTGETTVTITAADYTGETRLEETITFTDADDYTFDYQIRQKAQSTGGSSNLYMGDINITQFYFGENQVNTIYLGDIKVFGREDRKYINITPSSASTPSSLGAVLSFVVESNIPWVVDGDPELSFQPISGYSGQTIIQVIVQENEEEFPVERFFYVGNSEKGILTEAVIYQPAPPSGQPADEVWYTSTDGNIVTPHTITSFGGTVSSNTYNAGKGVIEVSQNITSFATYAFSGATTLASVSVPPNVEKFNSYAFSGCTSLSSITLNEGLESVGNRCFIDCTALEKMTFPASLISIGTYVLSGCTSLESITVLATTPPTISSSTLNGTSCPIYVPAGSVNTYKAATYWKNVASRIRPIPS